MKLGVLTVLGAVVALASGSTATAANYDLVVHGDRPGAVIEPEIYGHFAEHLGRGIYEGVWVGENSNIPNIRGYRRDVVEALRAIKPPVVRWPGGCFADDYHWRDGIGPRAKRPVRINNLWGGVEEPNAFGTHEFMDFAELIGTKTYIAANMGSGSPTEMAQWIEYMTSDSRSALAQERRANGREKPWKVDYLGIGNETWGCGGNMRPEVSADLHRQFATFVRPPKGVTVLRVASGSNGDDRKWTEAVMAGAAEHMEGYSLHHYTLPTGSWTGSKGSATAYGEDQWISTLKNTLRMDEIVTAHSAIMDKHDPQKKVGLYVDEWGLWTDQEPGSTPGFLYQLNSVRDALVAAINFNIFHAHAERVRMGNIAQMVNVLQALLITDGPKMVRTPTYHVFDMYQGFKGATNLPVEVRGPEYKFGSLEVPGVHASAGRDAAGVTHVALVNLDPKEAATLDVRLPGVTGSRVTGRVLTAPSMTTGNTFANPDAVRPQPFTGATISGGRLGVSLPPRSVVVLALR
jgi:alpha-N-arabinofuranosidase